jgi:hypothetical protein
LEHIEVDAAAARETNREVRANDLGLIAGQISEDPGFRGCSRKGLALRHGSPSNLLPNIAVIETLAATAGE